MKLLRWVIAIPAGMLAGTLVNLVAFLVFPNGFQSLGSVSLIVLAVLAFISGAAAIFVSTAIAPSYKRYFAWALAAASVAILAVYFPEDASDRLFYAAQNSGCVLMAAIISLRHSNLQSPGPTLFREKA